MRLLKMSIMHCKLRIDVIMYGCMGIQPVNHQRVLATVFWPPPATITLETALTRIYRERLYV